MWRQIAASAAWARRLSVVSGVVAFAALVSAVPAGAHASGELPTAELSADGSRVVIDYVAPPDDAAVIGEALGYLREGAMLALLGGSTADLPTDDEVATFSRSPGLRAYLEEHVAVSQSGRACPGEAFPSEDFLADGARLEFVCPTPVDTAEIRITVLHDEDPAYRTFSVDGTAQYAIHSASSPEHTWDFTLAAAGDGRIDPVLVAGAAVVVAALVGTIVFVPRRRRRANG